MRGTLKEKHFQNYSVKQKNLWKIQRRSHCVSAFASLDVIMLGFLMKPKLFRKKDFSLINY